MVVTVTLCVFGRGSVTISRKYNCFSVMLSVMRPNRPRIFTQDLERAIKLIPGLFPHSNCDENDALVVVAMMKMMMMVIFCSVDGGLWC